MGKCPVCGKSVGVFSINRVCDECKLAEEKQKELDGKKALAPYLAAKSMSELPIIDPDMSTVPPGAPRLVLKKNEKIFAAAPVFLCEYRKDRKFEYGSHGVSLRLMKGISYRVGQGRGHFISDDILVETSKGLLLVTNQRIFLLPVFADDKPVTVKISDIESYAITENAITIFKVGRQKPMVFKFHDNKSGVVDDIFGITLNLVINEQ